MPTTITNSDYITSLDSKIIASLCDGKFHVDITPSVFVAGGQVYLEGASVQIVNPVGVTIKNYPTSGYDIYPPFTDEIEYSIPLTAGNYQYGTYIITVRLTDENGENYFIEKSVNICPPDKKNKTKKVGCLNATIKGNCNDGKVIIMLDSPPNYKGKTVLSQVNELTLYYPTESELDPLEFEVTSLSVQLYEGEYKVIGEVCATYNYGDNVYFEVKYEVKCSKIIKCSIDKCCVQAKLAELNLRLKSDCTTEEKDNTLSIMFESLWLLNAIDYASFCGEDASDLITELEDVLGCTCTCNCNEGTPIINNEPVPDFVFEGCGFEEQTVGNTKTITIENRTNTVTEGNDLITVGEVTNNEDCTTSQPVSVNEEALTAFIEDVIEESIPSNLGYLRAFGVLNQTGTNPPVVTVWENDTLIVFGSPVRGSAGSYTIPITGMVLNSANVVAITGQLKSQVTSMGVEDASNFYIQTQDIGGGFDDDKLINTFFEIRVKI